ncbi:hypothetical protein CerSpe_202690 [Prunus speciosa]
MVHVAEKLEQLNIQRHSASKPHQISSLHLLPFIIDSIGFRFRFLDLKNSNHERLVLRVVFAVPEQAEHERRSRDRDVVGGVNLDKFLGDVESVKEKLKELERLHQNLQSSYEHSKTLHNAKAIKEIRSHSPPKPLKY